MISSRAWSVVISSSSSSNRAMTSSRSSSAAFVLSESLKPAHLPEDIERGHKT